MSDGETAGLPMVANTRHAVSGIRREAIPLFAVVSSVR